MMCSFPARNISRSCVNKWIEEIKVFAFADCQKDDLMAECTLCNGWFHSVYAFLMYKMKIVIGFAHTVCVEPMKWIQEHCSVFDNVYCIFCFIFLMVVPVDSIIFFMDLLDINSCLEMNKLRCEIHYVSFRSCCACITWLHAFEPRPLTEYWFVDWCRNNLQYQHQRLLSTLFIYSWKWAYSWLHNSLQRVMYFIMKTA